MTAVQENELQRAYEARDFATYFALLAQLDPELIEAFATLIELVRHMQQA